jgi:phage terminase large subunit
MTKRQKAKEKRTPTTRKPYKRHRKKIPEIDSADAVLSYTESLQQDPVWFIEDEILGDHLWRDQRRIIESVRDNFKTAWRSCHGIGKSFCCARLVLWWLFSFPYSIVLTTAPTWRQVEDILWKEIRSAYNNSKEPLGGDLAPSATRLSISGIEWMALGLSTNDPNRFQGYHAEHLLVIADEACGVDEDIFDAIMGVLTSAHCRLVLIGNPTDIGGQFYRACRNPEGWSTGKTSAWDTPNFTKFGITRDDIINNTWRSKVPLKKGATNKDDFDWPYPWLITPKWAYDAFLEWGTAYPAWFARVEGDFPEQGEYNVIPLSWIEKAQDRWENTNPTGQPILGVDVARGGMDKSAIAARVDNKITFIQTFSGLDTQQLAGEVIRIYREMDARVANVEANGMGVGVIDELKKHRESGIVVNEVNVSTRSEILDKKGNRLYANLRSELWWTLRQSMDPKGDMLLALPPRAASLAADLSAPKYDLSSGYTQVELKEKTKDRLGRSPDEADAVIMTFAPLARKHGKPLNIPLPAPHQLVRPAWKIAGYHK